MWAVPAAAATAFLVGPAAIVPASAGAAQSCESLASLSLPNTMITQAQSVAAGDLPASCRVSATLTPSSDSNIKIEVWLPASGWNGKFEAVGNGGWNGTIDRNALAAGFGAATQRRARTRDTRAAVGPGCNILEAD
jgi:feruloyl esterase